MGANAPKARGRRALLIAVVLLPALAWLLALPGGAGTAGGPLVWLATAFGLGHTPLAPGTAGALAGVPLALVILRLRPRTQLVLTAALALCAIPLCRVAASEDEKDPSRIVADEWLTFPLATVGLPLARHPLGLAAVFAVSRGTDSLKPPPAAAAERLPGGIGMVADDLIANAWTWLFAAGFRTWWSGRHDSRRDPD